MTRIQTDETTIRQMCRACGWKTPHVYNDATGEYHCGECGL